MLKVVTIFVAGYCWLTGGLAVLVCTMNGTPALLVAGLIHLGVAILATVALVRMNGTTDS
jgi:hypothetical protein